MIKKLLLFLVVTTIFQNTSSGQGAEFYGNAFWQSASNRIVIRLALRNPTGSSTGQMRLMGMRFGFQYNAAQVTYAGYRSLMPGLDDASFLSFIGPDTAPNAEDIDASIGASRTAFINTGGTKVMQQRYINRSTTDCNNGVIIPSGTMAVLIDIYFTLNTRPPSYYHLTDPDYGFGDTEFIAQFLHKWNGGHTGNLTDAYKEIAIVIIRQSGAQNPYQPFDASNCINSNFNPITIGSDDINFINPINGVLSGKVSKLDAEERNDHVALDWKVEHNELVDHYEIERKDENGSFRTIGLILGDNKNPTTQYQFKDKITSRDLKLYYRVKIVGVDQVITYSDIKMVRPGSAQQNGVKIFPNPTSDFIRFQSPLINGSYVCRIYSNEGRMVLTANTSSVNTSIDIKSLKAGSYFIEMYHPQSGKRFYSQFSKQ